jgi:hypothetical protein
VAEVDDPVGVRHDRLVVRDDDDRLAGVDEPVEKAEQPLDRVPDLADQLLAREFRRTLQRRGSVRSHDPRRHRGQDPGVRLLRRS